MAIITALRRRHAWMTMHARTRTAADHDAARSGRAAGISRGEVHRSGWMPARRRSVASVHGLHTLLAELRCDRAAGRDARGEQRPPQGGRLHRRDHPQRRPSRTRPAPAGPAWRAVRTALEEGRTIHDVQRDRFGFTDADLGAALAEAWEFPPPLCEAVRFHASSERSLREPDALAALVLKARRFARASGTTDGLDEESQITPDIEWASPATASAFQRRGGMDGI